jgi:hypothetical protein
MIIPSPNNMASIYEKEPLYKVVMAWDDNDPNLSEVYKLQSSYSCKKNVSKYTRITESMLSNLPSTRWSLSSIRERKNVILTGQTPLWSLKTCSRATTKQPGNRCFMSTYRAC